VSRRVFYGWWVVLASAVGLSLHTGPVVAATFGVFLEPMASEFGWTRAQLSLAFSLFTLSGAVAALAVGRAIDRVAPRLVILSSTVLFALAVASAYLLSDALWHLYALFVVLGLVGSGTTPLTYSKVIAEWFDRRRGLALALGIVGSSVGSLLLPPATDAVIDRVGWRLAYACLGLLVAGVALPVLALLLRDTPEKMGLRVDGRSPGPVDEPSGAPAAHLSGRAALRTVAFWRMAGAFSLTAVSFAGCFVHLVPLLTDRGAARQSAALAMSVCAAGSLVGRLVCGYLLDRYPAERVAGSFFLVAAIGMAMLLVTTSVTPAFMAAALIGLMVGAEFDLIAYLCSRYFGLRAFGEVYSYLFALFVLGSAIGPPLMGWAYDATGSYQPALGGFVAMPLIAIVLILGLGAPQADSTATAVGRGRSASR